MFSLGATRVKGLEADLSVGIRWATLFGVENSQRNIWFATWWKL